MEWRDFCRNTVDNSCSGDAETKLDPELEKMLEGNHLEPLRNALADAGISSMDGFLETDLLNFMIERELYSVTRCKAIVASLRAKIEKVPYDMINLYRVNIDKMLTLSKNILDMKIEKYKSMCVKNIARIDALSPLKTLTRGYSVIQNENGHVITSKEDVKKNDKLNITLKDGKIDAVVV